MEVFNPWPPVILPPPRVWTLPDPCCILNPAFFEDPGSERWSCWWVFFGVFSGWWNSEGVLFRVENAWWLSWILRFLRKRMGKKNMVHTSRDELSFFGAKVYQVKCCKGPIWFLHSRKRTWLAGRSPSSIGNAFHGLWKSLCNWVVYPWN